MKKKRNIKQEMTKVVEKILNGDHTKIEIEENEKVEETEFMPCPWCDTGMMIDGFCDECGKDEDGKDNESSNINFNCPFCDNEKGPVIDGFCTHCGADIDQ